MATKAEVDKLKKQNAALRKELREWKQAAMDMLNAQNKRFSDMFGAPGKDTNTVLLKEMLSERMWRDTELPKKIKELMKAKADYSDAEKVWKENSDRASEKEKDYYRAKKYAGQIASWLMQNGKIDKNWFVCKGIEPQITVPTEKTALWYEVKNNIEKERKTKEGTLEDLDKAFSAMAEADKIHREYFKRIGEPWDTYELKRVGVLTATTAVVLCLYTAAKEDGKNARAARDLMLKAGLDEKETDSIIDRVIKRKNPPYHRKGKS